MILVVDPDWFILENRALVNMMMAGVTNKEDRLDCRQDLRILAGQVLKEQPDPFKARVPFYNRGRNIVAKYRRSRVTLAAEAVLEARPSSDTPRGLSGLVIALEQAGLNDREVAVATCLASGMSREEAAAEVNVSAETLHRCVLRMKVKLIASGFVAKGATF